MPRKNAQTTRRNETNGRTRAIRAITASGSLLAIIVAGLPWADEYLHLRREAESVEQLQVKLSESRQREQQLNRIETQINEDLSELHDRSIEPNRKALLREKLIESIRQAKGKIRRLEIAGSNPRPWAASGDNARNEQMPLYGEESRFVLHSHLVELQVDGSLESIQRFLTQLASQNWFMTTQSLVITPAADPESPLRLDIEMVFYGLAPRHTESEEEFASRKPFSATTLTR